MKLIAVALAFTLTGPAFAETITMTPKATPVAAPSSPILEQLWSSEMASIRRQPPSGFRFRAWTYDAVFTAPNGDRIVASIFQGPQCDNGPNDKDATAVPSLCPARIARVSPSGKILGKLALLEICNASILDSLGSPPDTERNQTTVAFTPDTGEIAFDAIMNGKPWDKPIGSLRSCHVRRFI